MKKQVEKDPYRLGIYEKIQAYERQGRFDEDVEADPPTKPLHPQDIEYLDKTLWEKCRRGFAFASAHVFYWVLKWKKEIIVKPTQGLENLRSVPGGAVITCNHFHPFDSFIMQLVYNQSRHKGRMYRVIREGNYTNFPGYYGFLMRNCNTLPLSANLDVMKKFLKATQRALQEGNCILIYPEQSLWWNYRKPKPMKSGSFDIAVKNHVPIVPCFITMEDTPHIGADGFPVQAYTPHVGAPIYPDTSLSRSAAREKMRQEAELFCRQTYETVYGIPLTYEKTQE